MFAGFSPHGLADLGLVCTHFCGLTISSALAGMMEGLSPVPMSQLPAGSPRYVFTAMAE